MSLLDGLFGSASAPAGEIGTERPGVNTFSDRLMSPLGQVGLALLANHGTPKTQRGMFDGVGEAVTGAVTYQRARQKEAEAEQKKNDTLAWLQQNDPEVAGMVQAGMDVSDAYTLAFKRKEMEQRQTAGGGDNMTSAMRNWNFAQQNPEFARYLGIGQPGAGMGDAPSGYRYTEDGNLSFIPGGPADPALKGGNTGASGVVGEGMKLTEGQSKDLNYYQRGNAALPTIEANEGAMAGPADRLLDRVPGAGNYLTSDKYQVGNQAGREFLAAILRKDTGAAITNQEFEIYAPMYLPQPGDSEALLQQKRVARTRAMESIRLGLGTATPLADAPVSQNPGADEPAGSSAGRTSSGLSWSIEP